MPTPADAPKKILCLPRRARFFLLHLLQQEVGIGAIGGLQAYNQPERLKRQNRNPAEAAMAPRAIG